MSGHELTLTMEARHPVLAHFECHEGPAAMCNVTCLEGCESWEEDHEHELTPTGRCNAVEWFECEGWDECYIGPVTFLRSGPVTVEWSDGYVWLTRIYLH